MQPMNQKKQKLSPSTCRVRKPTNKPGVPGSGLPTFLCGGCKARHAIGLYAIGQCGMGHTLTHTCDCGQRHSVEGSSRGYRVTYTKEPANA